MPDLEDRIRQAYRPVDMDHDAIDRAWDGIDPADAARAPAPRRRRSASRRGLVAIAIAVVSISSVALAQPAVRDLVTSDGERSAERMEIFEDGDRVGAAGLSKTMRHMLDGSGSSGFQSVDADDLRVVLDYERDGLVVKLRSAPSKDGQGCLYYEIPGKSGGGSCSFAMKYNGHVTVGVQRDIRMGSLVTGLADDAVDQVRVVLSTGEIVDAVMGRNGYLLHLPDPDVRTRGLLVDLKDGTTLDLAMNGCLRSQLERPARDSRLGCGFGMGRGPETATPSGN